MQSVKACVIRVASCESNVLITGETGTGKEVVAELIHENSARRQRPFIRINCPAIPETLIESELFGHERGAFTGADSLKEGMLRTASGGTIFFDEIGDLSTPAQAKILRTVETKEIHRLGSNRAVPIDLRVLAATNKSIDRLADEGGFRRDLYFRLNVARIHLPPLRERKEDVPLLLRHYTQEFNRQLEREVEGFSDEALDQMLRYDWPGNVRELRNLIEACFLSVASRRISLSDMPEHFRQRLARLENRLGDERERLLSTLTATKWNKSDAALRLRWSRMTLYRKMAKYRIPNGKFPQGS
jgi:two-component system response regulator HydG/two-component system response regulator AtoC